MARFKTTLGNFAVIIFGFLFSVLTCEAVVRLLEPAQLQVQAVSDRPTRFYLHESSRSLRDVYHAEKLPGTFRIAVVGDSISFAPQMQAFDAFPAKLEQYLNLNSLSGQRVEVLNLGTPGFSTEKEIPVVRQALDLKSDLVILQICLNDPERESLTAQHKSIFTPFKPSGAWGWLFSTLHSLNFIGQRIHNYRTRAAYDRYFLDLFELPENWDRFSQAFTKIVKISRSNSIKLPPVVFPLLGKRIDANYPFLTIHQKIAGLMQESDVPYLDLLSTFSNLDVNRLVVVPGQDLHPNEIAHRLAAEAILKYLGNNQLVPPQFLPKHTAPMRKDVIGPHAVDAQL